MKTKAQDNRTIQQFKNNFEFGTWVEREIMIALKTWYQSHGIKCKYEKIGKDVFLDGNYRNEPDYFFYKPEKHTLEIKYTRTGNFIDDTIAVRTDVVNSMKNDPQTYPRGKVLIATPWEFSTVSVKDIHKCEYFKPWDKKVYKLDPLFLKWNNWLIPLRIAS